MKMDTKDDSDIDRLLQEELDAMSVGDVNDENFSDESDDYTGNIPQHEAEQIVNDTRDQLERAMQERLAAFENEINMNFKRYEIDYDEIDQLLQKPSGNNDHDIQTNVARECGIEREELDRILHSVNAEESETESADESDDDEGEELILEPVQKSVSSSPLDQADERSPREQEDPNKKIHEERLAESHRRMLDELALLEQRRTEEEERYAAVLQEQQTRLAEEYLRLQESLNETARQTHQEKLQLDTVSREQERMINERQHKMAIVIQAWFRGKRVYHRYRGEILKRTAPHLRAIAKKRKKKEQEALMKATRLAEIEEATMHEQENRRDDEQKANAISMPSPASNRLSSPLPTPTTKQSNPKPFAEPLPTKVPAAPGKDNLTRKKKTKPQPTPESKPLSISSATSAQIVQLENPADFVPTIIPEERRIFSPRPVHTENRPIASPRPPAEQRPQSSNRRPLSARTTSPLIPVISSVVEEVPKTIRSTDHPLIPASQPITTPPSVESVANIPSAKINQRLPLVERSETFDKYLESPLPPSMSHNNSSPPAATLKRADTFVSDANSSHSADSVITSNVDGTEPIIRESQSNTFNNPTDNFRSSIDLSVIIDTPTIHSEQPQVKSARAMIPPSPRVATPRKAPVEEKVSVKVNNAFLTKARRWAKSTTDNRYAHLLGASEEAASQVSIRKTGTNLRKLPDIDAQILKKLVKEQPSQQIDYLLLEQLLTPCSLSSLSTTFPNLTHLTLRQCKLIQLIGLDSCSSLTALDVENNWLEQIHLQLNQLEYLNMSRNRITSLLSVQTPRLKYLDVSNNRLTRLNGIENFVNLNVLLARSNQLLTSIGLQGCTRLLSLDLSDNHLVEMDQLDQCPLLVTIKATSNALIQMPSLFNAILLHELDLSSNSLSSLDELLTGQWLPFLTHLRLSSNSLQDLLPIELPSLEELELAFNQLSDFSLLKEFIKGCPSLNRLNLEQNPVLHDATSLEIPQLSQSTQSISLLPRFSTDPSSESIQSYLNFLSNLTSMLIELRQMVEQYQIEPFQLLKSIHHQCEQYMQAERVAPVKKVTPIAPTPVKVLSPEDQSIVRLQSHWRRRLLERNLKRRHRAAQIIQARWRGYIVRQRMRMVRHNFNRHTQGTYEEIDLTQFDFDEAAFDARFQRPRTPVAHIRQVWQPLVENFSKTTPAADFARPNSSHSSSVASSRAKPLVEPLVMPSRTNQITDEWGFTPSSSTAALMLKRAERMKWNVERKHKRENMDAFQRLQMARQHEQPPGSLRLARRHPAPMAAKTTGHTKTLSPPSTAQSRPNRVFEWVHTQVARFDESSVEKTLSPRHERKRLPSLDGSTDSMNRARIIETQQQHRWSASTVSVRQPPPLLPPITGQQARF